MSREEKSLFAKLGVGIALVLGLFELAAMTGFTSAPQKIERLEHRQDATDINVQSLKETLIRVDENVKLLVEERKNNHKP